VAGLFGSVATMGGASVAWAADPGGNNGTVKIQTADVDDVDNPDPANDPHVPCTFQVAFFGFDTDQTATITFTIQPPSGSGGDVLLTETKTVSDDPAGGSGDVDAVFTYDGSTFGLDKFTAQPNQGYHVKLTIESAGVPSGVKHKVFWLQCAAPTTPAPSVTPTEPVPTTTAPGGGGGNPDPSGSTTPVPPTTTTSGGDHLPVTGAGLTGIILAGAALIGGGTALLIARRRRTAEDQATTL
jgi:LPXTG-motif cell wall-anchored protein